MRSHCTTHSAGRPGWRLFALLFLPALAGLAAPLPAMAVTHSELLGDTQMNPKRFAGHFANFRYEYYPSVQPVDAFLRSERGDCDDYAILADEVLRRRQFETLLVHVRLAGMTAHAVCYVTQNRAYLDYNNRDVAGNTIPLAKPLGGSFWTFGLSLTFRAGE